MKAILRAFPGGILGACLLAWLCPPASAQFYNQPLPQYNQQQPAYGYRNGQRSNGPTGTVQVLPPESLGPGSLGLLEREFQYMRNTAPNPDRFMYGRWNPRQQVITPPVTVYPGTGYGGWPVYGGYSYYDPYGGYPGYGPYGYGYGYAAPAPVIQRQVVVVPGQPANGGNGGLTPPPAPARPDVEPPKRGETDQSADDDFYLKPRPATESISDVLDDVRKAWLNGDWERLKSHFRVDGKVRIYPKGQYRYSVESRDFTAMLKDAMARIDTVSFDFERPKSDDMGRVFVAGKHVFTDAEKEKRTTYVSYVFEKLGGHWKIVEAGSSAEPIGKHND